MRAPTGGIIGSGIFLVPNEVVNSVGGYVGLRVISEALKKSGGMAGGDAFFDYIGAYTAANGRWKGELVNREHTLARSERPLFSGHEVGIGFSGTCDKEGALLEATALAGKRSLRMTAVLKLMHQV